MDRDQWVDFEFPVTVLGLPVAVRLGAFDGRWFAIVKCGGRTTNGLGPSAREALTAGLQPHGVRATARLMAEPMMFGVSSQLRALRSAT